VLFEGCTLVIGGLDGVRVRLVDATGSAQVLLLAHLLAGPGFEVLEAGPPPARLDPVGLLDALPAAVIEQAREWERHVVEVQTGLPPDAPQDAVVREAYDPARHTLAARSRRRPLNSMRRGVRSARLRSSGWGCVTGPRGCGVWSTIAAPAR
jgi:hypothetical protein